MAKRKLVFVVVGIILILFGFYFPTYFYGVYAEFFIQHFAKSNYADDFLSLGFFRSDLMMFLIFSLVSFFLNLWTLSKTNRLTVFGLITHTLFDQVFIPLTIFLMVLYNDTRVEMPVTSSLLYPPLITLWVVAKHLILLLIWKNKQLPIETANSQPR